MKRVIYKKVINENKENRTEFLLINFDYEDGNDYLAKIFNKEFNMKVEEKKDYIWFSIIKLCKKNTCYELLWHEDIGNIAGYKLASEGAFYKNNSTEASSNKFVENQKYSLSNVEARKWYLEQEAKIPGMIDSSLSLEEQAKQAFNLRNNFRTEARELMVDRATAESLYKTDPNWSWEKIVQKQVEKGLSGDDIYKEIIASSQRSREAVNKSLGVK